MSRTLQDYQKLLIGKDCKWCRNREKAIMLDGQPIQHYNHDGGYAVEGYVQKQWLYVECPKCDYQWAFHKLGIGEIKE